LEVEIEALRAALVAAAKLLHGATVLRQRVYGWARSARWRSPAGWLRQTGSARRVAAEP
jgi:hypothetical protein